MNLSDRHSHAAAESAAWDDAHRKAPTLYRDIDACDEVRLEIGGPDRYRTLSEAEIREVLDALENAARYRFAKTLLGQTIVMGVLREQGADVLDKVLDAAMAEEA